VIGASTVRSVRLVRAFAILLGALALGSCGGTTSPSGTGTASLTILVVPSPITATNTLNPAVFDYDIRWTVTITETAGVGGSLHFVSGTLYDPLSGQQTGHTALDSNDLLVLAGANHLAPRGTLTVQQQMSYRLASRARQALLSVSVEMLDDNGHLIDPATLIQVQ
jgi:hypothetical protein